MAQTPTLDPIPRLVLFALASIGAGTILHTLIVGRTINYTDTLSILILFGWPCALTIIAFLAGGVFRAIKHLASKAKAP